MMSSNQARNWDPEVESPATIAIIGGGPIGIEAALYARFLGYFVELFEAHRLVGHVTSLEDRVMSLTMDQACSVLGRKAIVTQDPSIRFSELDRMPTYQEWADLYLLPLARTDLIFDSVHVHTPVKSVSRLTTGNGSSCSAQERANDQFRLLVESQNRGEWTSLADIVIDCSGWSHRQVGMAPGGGRAIGEEKHQAEILYRIPSSSKLVGAKHWLLWGSSPQAIATVEKFIAAGQKNAELRLTWFVPVDAKGVEEIEVAKEKLTNGLQQSAFVPCLGIEALARSESGKWTARITMPDETTIDVLGDHVVSLPIAILEETFLTSLRQTYRVDDAPNEATDTELNLQACPGWRLTTAEPHYYVLGSKRSLGQNELTANHWKDLQDQVRDLFAMLGGRQNLDLYADFAKRFGSEID